MTMFVNLL